MGGAKLNLISSPSIKDKDSTEETNQTNQIIIDVAQNGFVVTTNAEEDMVQKVYLFSDSGPNGAKAMVQDLIENLGLIGKVKIQ